MGGAPRACAGGGAYPVDVRSRRTVWRVVSDSRPARARRASSASLGTERLGRRRVGQRARPQGKGHRIMSYRLPGHDAQFGGWCPPPPSEQPPSEGSASSAKQDEADEHDEHSGKRRADQGDEMERKKRRTDKKHKREKKHKKKHKKRRKHTGSSSDDSDSGDSEGGAGVAPAHSSLAPDDWFAARLAKGYAKAERAAQRKKKAKEAAMQKGQDINALRAEWSGADVKPPEYALTCSLSSCILDGHELGLPWSLNETLCVDISLTRNLRRPGTCADLDWKDESKGASTNHLGSGCRRGKICFAMMGCRSTFSLSTKVIFEYIDTTRLEPSNQCLSHLNARAPGCRRWSRQTRLC